MIVRRSTKVKNWTRFLKNDSSKESLFEYLATSAIQTYISEDRQLVITYRDGVISNPESVFINENLSPCDHEEADTRMIFHMEEILKSASSKILRTVDTDVVVLAVAASTRYDGKDIWINFGTGERKKILSAHQISAAIGRDKSVALPVFHAFTGCDTVSSFKSIGKKTAWQRWKVFDDVTKAFIDLSNGPLEMDSETQGLLERFVILLYDQTSSCISVNELRKELFTRGRSIDKIPPTSEVLFQHDRRTAYQGGYIWGKTHEKLINPPEATNWGLQKD